MQLFTNSVAEYLSLHRQITEARTVTEQALQYDFPETMPNLHGIITLRLRDPETAKQAFANAVARADTLLGHSAGNCKTLGAKALSLCGLALCGNDPRHVREAVRGL